MGLFAAALATTSVGIAVWNAYWLATPLRDAITALLG
jgi:flagellar motor component MotA